MFVISAHGFEVVNAIFYFEQFEGGKGLKCPVEGCSTPSRSSHSHFSEHGQFYRKEF